MPGAAPVARFLDETEQTGTLSGRRTSPKICTYCKRCRRFRFLVSDDLGALRPLLSHRLADAQSGRAAADAAIHLDQFIGQPESGRPWNAARSQSSVA